MTAVAPIGQTGVVVGCGITGVAVARALLAHGHDVVLVDDTEGRAEDVAASLGAGARAVAASAVAAAISDADAFFPTPGLPASHPANAAAVAAGVPTLSEFDLAGAWDDRPVVSVTGTNGKTTVTTLIASMLSESGIAAAAVGNTEVPLVAALDDPSLSAFVVESSSFRLAHTRHFAPQVATWLNFAPDHVDIHGSIEAYEAAKARQWTELGAGSVAVANLDDDVVMSHVGQRGHAELHTFSVQRDADYWVDGDTLRCGPAGFNLPASTLPRQLPHDLSNALAAIASAVPLGATEVGITAALSSFAGLPHRMQWVASSDGVDWFDDSKATTPHAVAAAVSGLDDVVLIAGGRNKGIDLSVLGSLSTVRAVVGIGESGPEIVAAFDGRPATVCDSMAEAVAQAASFARPGDAVVLSPGCASFDWYQGYAARGDDFAGKVHEYIGGNG